ncbi:kinase-like domain-containing protein [Rhizophagus clarus]|uniref:Kinase-like domain-containing protein n=1 Tax=Rhizophagus clarus TaxID=94130 RepID=A0A8H3M6A0_9GLOM|nr:kinase-like domain-containing protein [Rhizophagus clarus]
MSLQDNQQCEKCGERCTNGWCDKKYERVGREVALKCLDNSQNITKEFLNEVKAYSIKKYNCINKIYGISQNPDTKIILWFFINDDSSYMDYFDIFSPDLSTPVAPEVLRGKSYTQVADIYSLGMIMYSLITGRQPFENRAHEYELALSICNGIRPEIPEIPELESNWYINIMKKCWDSNPGNRPNIESILTILNEEGKDTSLKNIMKSSK